MAKPKAPELSSSTLAISPKTVLLYGIGALCLHFWVNQVCKIVPNPYLDEVFHIPQAQRYWAGSWQTWDPKITTPPGLYIYSYLFAKICAAFGAIELSVRQLRISVEVLLMVIPAVLLQCHPRYHKYKQWSPTLLTQIMHSNLNIMLCPLLFFFSALYYTDILSAFTVLEVYRWHIYLNSDPGQDNYLLSKLSLNARTMICEMAVFFFGLFAMLVRQTNVFWVAIFLGGLQVVKTLNTTMYPALSVADRNVKDSANRNTVYGPLMQDAAVEDYALTVFSLISVAPRHIFRLVCDLLPYLAMLVAFGAFVVYNEGVVLGDKENHMASIHFPQMLYIWPCIVFFSWPVLLPSIANISQKRLPRLTIVMASMGLVSVAVHFNTIVHPFTLADNRHYVFYVFRILLRHPSFKYAVIPVYFTCAWLVINAMGEATGEGDLEERPESKHGGGQDENLSSAAPAADPTHVSFVLVWLTATSLSLVTAPLVEPRYFIVPWLVWRTNLPVETGQQKGHERSGSRQQNLAYQGLAWLISNRLWIETAWYLLINLVTCYVFLYKGFVWPQEPGKVQRFMW